MRRKTDFFTLQDKSKILVTNALEEQLRLFNEEKDRQEKLKKK